MKLQSLPLAIHTETVVQAVWDKALLRETILKLAPSDATTQIESGTFQLTMKDSARFDFMRMASELSIHGWLGWNGRLPKRRLGLPLLRLTVMSPSITQRARHRQRQESVWLEL